MEPVNISIVKESDECFMMRCQNVADKPDLTQADGNLRGPVGYSTMGL